MKPFALLATLAACSRAAPDTAPLASSTEPLWLFGRRGQLVRMAGEMQQARVFDTEIAAMTRFDAYLAWAVGVGRAWHSSDGGETWVQQAVPVREALYAVSFASPTHGVAVGEHGVIITTEDGGAHWRIEPSPVSIDLRTVKLATVSGVAIAAGDQGTLLRSGDSGRTWTQLATHITESLSSADVNEDGSVGVVAGTRGRAFTLKGDTFGPLSAGKADWHAARVLPTGVVLAGQGGMLLCMRECRNLQGSEDFVSLATHPGLLVLGRSGTLYRLVDNTFEPMLAIADAVALDDLK